jgi:DNA polymerase-1
MPEICCVCWDYGGSWARKAFYPDYKKRDLDKVDFVLRNEILRQIGILWLELPYFGIRQIRREGVEADDLIGFLAEELRDVMIVSNDKDMWQLVNESTSVFYPPKQILIHSGNFLQEVGMTPELFLFYKTIIGDHVDNISGLSRFGKITAKRLITTYGAWHNWFDAEWRIKPSILESLNKIQRKVLQGPEVLETLTRNYALMKLGYLIPESKDGIIGEFYSQKGSFNEAEVKEFFKQYGFVYWLSRFKQWTRPFTMLV